MESCAREVTMVKHLRTHNGDKPYKYLYCKKSFALEHILVDHQRTHTGDKPYLCTQCEEPFALNGILLYKLAYEWHTILKIYNC